MEGFLSDVFLFFITGLIGIIFGYQRYLHKAMDLVKDDLHHFEVRIAREHLTKNELREMLSEQEKRFNEQIQHHFKLLEERLKK